MGGDFGPQTTMPASLLALREYEEMRAFLVGDMDQISSYLVGVPDSVMDRVEIVAATQAVGMGESPSAVLRTKKDSSMRVALELVKSGKADACVSAGNTGALMALSRYVLRTCETIDRPAIMSAIPTSRGHTYMLDLGANVECDSEQLYQFALIGNAVLKNLHHIESPRIALLNVGEEDIKGNDTVRRANELLKSDAGLNYVGYVEGTDILSGKVDVIVCDGFVGNIALKSIEGVAKFFLAELRHVIQKNLFTRLLGFIALPLFKGLYGRFDPGKYNGASLVGLNGVVVKSHGSANVQEYVIAIGQAVEEVRNNIPGVIEKL